MWVTDGIGTDVSSNASHIANINPLRYRGYYYDRETGLYYLNSRYYDPETGRYINADVYVSTGQGILGNNMFAYCGNNPISRSDPNGNSWECCAIVVAIGVAKGNLMLVGAILGAMISIKSIYTESLEISKEVYQSSGSALRICTDGATKDYKSKSHQGETAMSGRLGVKTPADIIPYIVIPTNHPNYDKMIGCMGVVIDNSNGNYAYAVVGDGGSPKNGYGEVSLKAAWDLGYTENEANGAWGPEGKFTIILFPGTRENWTSDNLYQQIQDCGSKLYP